MIHYHSGWVVPISDPPFRDGWIAVDRDRIAAVSKHAPPVGSRTVDLGEVAVMPGLVNAHTHLELSYLRGQVPPAGDFVTWIRGVIRARRTRPDANSPEILTAIASAIEEATASGTAVVGDISNTLVTFMPLVGSQLAAVVFYELIRFNAADPEGFVEAAVNEIGALMATGRVRTSLAAHAPYSVSPLVFRAIQRACSRMPFMPCSVHLSESAAELEFIRAGSGPWRALLQQMGTWASNWVPPGCSPVQFLDDCGFLDAGVLAVHGVHMTRADLRRLAARGSTLVTCPRSNDYTGAGVPPVDEFYASGVRVAVGTDSLASCPDLNLFTELAAMRALAPQVTAGAILESATIQGARALGFDAEYGSIEPGKRARLLAVAVPPRVYDVEEYLVNGIAPDAMRWVE